MVWIGGPDEVIVRDRKLRPESAELGADPVGVLLRGDACFLRRFRDLVAVLIRPGRKKGPEAVEPVVAGEDVGNNGCVGVPDVGRGVHVVDRCRDIKSVFHNSP